MAKEVKEDATSRRKKTLLTREESGVFVNTSDLEQHSDSEVLRREEPGRSRCGSSQADSGIGRTSISEPSEGFDVSPRTPRKSVGMKYAFNLPENLEEHSSAERSERDVVPTGSGTEAPEEEQLEEHREDEVKTGTQAERKGEKGTSNENGEKELERGEELESDEKEGNKAPVEIPALEGNVVKKEYLEIPREGDKQAIGGKNGTPTSSPSRSRSTSTSSTFSNLRDGEVPFQSSIVEEVPTFDQPLACSTPKSATPRQLTPESDTEELRTHSVDYLKEQNDLKKMAERVRQLHLENETYSDIAEESGLNYSEQGRIKEEFRLAKSLIEQADRSIKEAEQHVDENHDLQKDLQCERQCGKKLREAETQETLALVYKRTKLPLDIPWLKTFLPSSITQDTASLRKFIMENKVIARFAQIAFAGLPYSGKSTLFEKIVGVRSTDPGLFIQEAVLLKCTRSGFCNWIPSTKEDAELLAIVCALAQLGSELSTLPDPHNTDPESFKFSDPDAHLERTLGRLQQLVNGRDLADTLARLISSILTFVNIWDIGVSKPAFELLPILAPKIPNLILVDLIHLARDADPKRLDNPPQLDDDALYHDRYHKCGNVLCRRSILHYFLRCVAPSCQALLVGTHADELCQSKHGSSVLQNLQQKMGDQAREMHIEKVISQGQLLEINGEDPEDADRVKKAIEELLAKDDRYEKEIPLSWIFLRCALLKRMYIRKRELFDVAKKCGLNDEHDLDKWLELFQSCSSIIHLSRDKVVLSGDEYVVLDPLEFFRGLYRLYFIDQLAIPEALKEDIENAKYGILSENLLKLTCRDCEDSCNLYFELLQSLGFLTQIAAPVQGYFFPSLRRTHCTGTKMRKPDSLFVRYPREVPFDNQPIFVCRFQKHLPGKIEIKKEKCYNILHLFWSNGTETSADIRIRFLLSFAEVSVMSSQGLQPDLARRVKTACIDAFEETKQRAAHLNYSLAVVCSNSACLQDENVFVEIETPTSDLGNLNCPKCYHNVATGDRKLWAEAAHQYT